MESLLNTLEVLVINNYSMSGREIERMFTAESNDKKRNGRGIHNRASRKGYYRGGVKMPSDFLSKKEKEKLNGEVRVYNMYEDYKDLNNCDLVEILKKSDSEVSKILNVIRAHNTVSAMRQRFDCSSGKIYSLFDKFGVVYTKRQKLVIGETREVVEMGPKARVSDDLKETNPSENSGLKLEYNGVFTKDELSSRLLSLDNITLDGISYKLKLTLEEVN